VEEKEEAETQRGGLPGEIKDLNKTTALFLSPWQELRGIRFK
jgi:hypothetical protein